MNKILILTDLYRPEPGGIEAFLTGIARNWEKDSVHVCIVSGKNSRFFNPQNLLEFDMREKYSITRLGSGGIVSFFLKKGSMEDSFSKILEVFGPDHILVCSLSLKIFYLIRTVNHRIPFSLLMNGIDVVKINGIGRLLYRSLLKNASNIFTISNYLKVKIRSSQTFVPFSSIHVIPPAIDYFIPERIRPDKITEELLMKIRHRKIFLCVGPLISWKGIDIAIKAFGNMDKKLTDRLHLLIIGSGPEFVFLQELVRLKNLEDRVTLTGFIPEEQLIFLMRMSHVFLQPNRNSFESGHDISVSLMEALHNGLPVIVGRSGGSQEIVDDGMNGFVVESGNVDELSLKMNLIASSNFLRLKMSRNAKRMAGRDFNMQKSCRFINDLIDGK